MLPSRTDWTNPIQSLCKKFQSLRQNWALLQRRRVRLMHDLRFRPRCCIVDQCRTTARRFPFQEISETQDAMVVIRLDDQLRKYPGQFCQRFALEYHRLRPNRFALERFEIWIFDRFAGIDEARSAIKWSPVERPHSQVGEDRLRVEQPGQDCGSRPCQRASADRTRPQLA